MSQKVLPPRGLVQNLLRRFLAKSSFFPVESSLGEATKPATSEEFRKDDWKWMVEELSRRHLVSWVMVLMMLRYVALLVILFIPGSTMVDRIVELLISDRVLDWAFKEMISHSFPEQKK
jgi:hypothetical protein